MDKLIVTISREFGSGGRLIGMMLAQDLGINYYDRRLIELTAEKSGLSTKFLEKSEENASSSFLYSISSNAYTSTSGLLQYNVPIGDKAFFAQSDVIRELAAKESCVIVGRCSGYILRDNPSRVNVFLRGDLEDRIKRAKESYGIEDAGERTASIDKGRASYHQFYTGEKWDNLNSFDIVLNTSVFGVEESAAAILALIKKIRKKSS